MGGLADVTGALPKALRRLGHDVRLVIPKYQRIRDEQFGLTTIVPRLPVPMNSHHEESCIKEG
ncbi:MAG: glycogen/starch synthase, partial [Chloroflexota bacterium]